MNRCVLQILTGTMARLTRSTCCCKRTCFQVEADAFPLRYQSYGNSEVIQVARRISQPLNIAQSAIDAVSKGRSSASTPIATATASHTPAEIYAKSHSSRPLTSAAAAAQTTRPVALSLNTTQNVPVDAASKGSRQYAAVAASAVASDPHNAEAHAKPYLPVLLKEKNCTRCTRNMDKTTVCPTTNAFGWASHIWRRSRSCFLKSTS
jgi:hypothetical protein